MMNQALKMVPVGLDVLLLVKMAMVAMQNFKFSFIFLNHLL